MSFNGESRRFGQHSKRKRCILGAVTVTLLLVVVGSGIMWASSSNQGKIVAFSPKNPVYIPANKDFTSAYMTFTYDGNYKPHQLPATDNDLENTILSADKNYDKRLAVSVSKLSGGQLNSNSAYNLRASQTDAYSSHQVTVSGGAATVWTKNDGSEQTAFIPYGDKIAVLSFSTSGTAGNLSPEVVAVLASFRWKV